MEARAALELHGCPQPAHENGIDPDTIRELVAAKDQLSVLGDDLGFRLFRARSFPEKIPEDV